MKPSIVSLYFQWEGSTTAGEVLVLAPIHKQGNSGTQVGLYIIGLFRKTKGTLGQKFFIAKCVDFLNS